MARTWGAQAWELTLQPSHSDALMFSGSPMLAGVVPTRDEIVAWFGQVSVAGWWPSLEAAVLSLPYAVRLTAGLLLAAVGAYLMLRSYRRAMRPTQADLVRRVAQAAHAKGEQAAAGDGETSQSVVAKSANSRESDVKQHFAVPQDGGLMISPSAPPFGRSLTPQAFLTTDQFTDGHAPWAVPLGHDLVRIGRHQENDIRLEDKTVHRYHALLHRSPDGDFLIRDLSGQAGNGVYVNGARIEQTALRPGDLVELGAVRLRFQQQLPS